MTSKYKKVIFLNMFDVRKYQKKKKKLLYLNIIKKRKEFILNYFSFLGSLDKNGKTLFKYLIISNLCFLWKKKSRT